MREPVDLHQTPQGRQTCFTVAHREPRSPRGGRWVESVTHPSTPTAPAGERSSNTPAAQRFTQRVTDRLQITGHFLRDRLPFSELSVETRGDVSSTSHKWARSPQILCGRTTLRAFRRLCGTEPAVSLRYFGIRDKQGSRLSVQFDSKDNTHHEKEQYRRASTRSRS
jgi:hypothetical protein